MSNHRAKLEVIKAAKQHFVRKQQFERAADVRNMERSLRKKMYRRRRKKVPAIKLTEKNSRVLAVITVAMDGFASSMERLESEMSRMVSVIDVPEGWHKTVNAEESL